MRSKLELFQVNKLEVNWSTVLSGWRGFKKLPRQLSIKDIIDYAVSLVSNDDSQPDEVWQLAGLSINDNDEVENLLKKLVLKENYYEIDQQRKWMVILLEEMINDLPDDCIQGLITLTDFWDKFEFPNDSPHIVQGRDNTISPSDYYNQENYLKLIEVHKKWVDEEIAKLKT